MWNSSGLGIRLGLSRVRAPHTQTTPSIEHASADTFQPSNKLNGGTRARQASALFGAEVVSKNSLGSEADMSYARAMSTRTRNGEDGKSG